MLYVLVGIRKGGKGCGTCFTSSSASASGVRLSPICVYVDVHARVCKHTHLYVHKHARLRSHVVCARACACSHLIPTVVAGNSSTSARPAMAAAADGGATSTRSGSTCSAFASSLRAQCGYANVRSSMVHLGTPVTAGEHPGSAGKRWKARIGGGRG